MPLTVTVIIPALNEGDNIADLVAAVKAQPVDQIVVVDNGSEDETGARAEAAGALVVQEPRRGYGYACAAGVAVARGDILLFLDGDFSFLPAEIPRLLGPLQAGAAELVLGSRVLGHIAPGAMPPHQRFGNRLTAGLMGLLYGVRVTDLGPYRAVRRELLESLDMAEMTFGWPTEMMVKAARQGARIQEVPVSYVARRTGQSKVSGTLRGSLLAGWHILSVTLRYARR
ncbi:MAG: glycosyltransferase family 2 protein [Caldilineaceae bacterium]|nr:glycosyltransferase family 2 protein [Caldilineaceae bacterium]